MFIKLKLVMCAAISGAILMSSSAMAENTDDLFSINNRLSVEGSGGMYVEGIDSGQSFMAYDIIDGYMVMEGDILLGKVTPDLSVNGAQSSITRGVRYRWPNGVVPYQFSSDIQALSKQNMIDAMAHWEQNTTLRFVERTALNADDYPDYINVRSDRANTCSSFVGRIGSRQDLFLAWNCGFGTAVHELGHAIGLWHEHSRHDRDEYVKINVENIDPVQLHNFNKNSLDRAFSVTPYDYRSIMHYPSYAFSANGLPTIESINPPGRTLGQFSGLSVLDIEDVFTIYPEEGTSSKVTIDNRDSDFVSKSSAWLRSGARYPYADDSEYSTNSDASFKWEFIVPIANDYKIQAYWTYWANRTSAASYLVESPLGSEEIFVDQQDNASTWFTLLDGSFDAGDAITITVTNAAAGSLSADATRLISIDPVQVSPITVDNEDDTTTKLGYWAPSRGFNPFSGQSEYSLVGSFNWEAMLPQASVYKVEAYWTYYPNRTVEAAYEIQHADGADTVVVDQRAQGGQWVELGSYYFTSGPANILLSNQSGQGTLSADAVRFTPIVLEIE